MRAFAILEILIALAVLILGFSAVIMVSFGNQSLLADGGAEREALARAESLIENAKALARTDIRLVVSTTTAEDMYTKSLFVSSSADPFEKQVAATVSWNVYGKAHGMTLLSLVSDFNRVAAGTTCDASLAGDWTHAMVTNISETFSVSALDAYRGRLYAVASTTSGKTDPTFFIFDIRNPSQPRLLGSLDNASTLSSGLNAVAVATSSSGSYAYLASASGANFATCTPKAGQAGGNCAELQVIDIANPASPAIVSNFEIPTSSPPYLAASVVGRSIFYKKGYLYLGLSSAKTVGSTEFNIIDVHDPTHPYWKGGYSVGAGVNAIDVENGYAYLSTDDKSNILLVLDVTDPAHPSLVRSVFSQGSFGAGRSVSVIGHTLYFGKDNDPHTPELYVFDVSDPAAPIEEGSAEAGSSIKNILVRDHLAFGVTAGIVSLWDVGNPSNVFAYSSTPLPGSGTALNCEGNTLYAGSIAGRAGFLSILTSS